MRLLPILVGALVAIYASRIRPWMLDWGATAEERREPLPGDEITPDANEVTTRALTLHAPTDAVWPWLVQMGQDRAGFYTHNWVERLLRSGIRDVHELVPAWQHLAVLILVSWVRIPAGSPVSLAGTRLCTLLSCLCEVSGRPDSHVDSHVERTGWMRWTPSVSMNVVSVLRPDRRTLGRGRSNPFSPNRTRSAR